MQRSSVVGQCRRAARLSAIRSRPTTSSVAVASRYPVSYYGIRSFSYSEPLAFQKESTAEQLALKTNVDPNSLHDPSEASRKLFSEFAFAFDIDGVLYQGRNRVEGAEKVVKMIRSNGIRYVFLTNGGGVSENKKARTLQKRLKIPEHEDVIRDRMILSHTPMSAWEESLKNEGTILITGSHPEQARQIALEYGFKRVVTPGDVLAACRDIFPFDQTKDGLHGHHEPLPDGKRIIKLDDPYTTDVPKDLLKIDQIFIWNDPRDWAVDTQIIYDLLISHQGYLGTISHNNGDTSLPNNGWLQDGQPGMWISNMDLLWRADYPINRFGTGAFMEALKGIWATATDGAKLHYDALGKPSQHTYQYAHNRLLQYYHDMACTRGEPHNVEKCHPLKRVYMIGDNPESDIRGANDFESEDGTEWISILVKTGVWRQTAAEKEPRYKPTVIVDDVVDAVVWALNNEGMNATREWLLSALSHTKGYVKLPEINGQLDGSQDSGISHPSEKEASEARL